MSDTKPVAAAVIFILAVAAAAFGVWSILEARPDEAADLTAAVLGREVAGWNWRLVYLGAGSLGLSALLAAASAALHLLARIAGRVSA